MLFIKKVGLLLIFFVLLNVISIYNFDYKSYFNTSETSSIQTVEESESILTNSFIKVKESFSDFFGSKEIEKPFVLILTKKESMIEIGGIFSNLDDIKKISDFLNINKEGEFQFDENRKINEDLLKRVSFLMPSFRDFFANDSKISIIDNEILLEGTLLDVNHKNLFDAIVARIDFPLKMNVIPAKIETSVQVQQDIKPIVSKPTKEEIQLTINKLLIENKITFERRSSNVTVESLKVIENISKILNDNQSFKVEVAGHTDSRGKDDLNKQISQDRASSVANILISKGVDKNRVSAVGYGEEFPIAQDDENGLSEINRRVEFNILGE